MFSVDVCLKGNPCKHAVTMLISFGRNGVKNKSKKYYVDDCSVGGNVLLVCKVRAK